MGPAQELSLIRRERLMSELRRHGSVRAAALAALLGVSDITVRRDITALAAQHRLVKVHGGAVLPTAADPPVARRRAAQPRRTLAMVVPSLDFYWPSVIAGARSAAAALGADIHLRGSRYDADEDRRQITRLVDEGRAEALLLAPDLDGGPELADWIAALGVPTVLVERRPPRWTPHPLEWVCTDHALGLEQAVRHLHQHGHRRIGLVVCREGPTAAHLADAWPRICTRLGLPADPAIHESLRPTAPGHRDLIADLLDRCRRTATTALIVHSDPDAITLAQFCAELGVSVPGDLALVSYDDEVAHLGEPALTAIRPPKRHVGRLAVETAMSRLIEGPRRPPQGILVTPALTVRASSIPPDPQHRRMPDVVRPSAMMSGDGDGHHLDRLMNTRQEQPYR
jgi:DNA-binding LacI/PurR family transcriptional regulator